VRNVILSSVGWVAVGLGFVGGFVQFRRVRERGSDGVSLATWTLFFLLGGYWMVYGLVRAHSAVVVLGSLLVWPLQIYIVSQLAPWRHVRTVLTAVGFLGIFCVLPGLVGGWNASLVGCGVAMTLIRTPQILQLVRSAEVSGVSAASWLLGATNSVLWIGYYFLTRQPSAEIATAMALVASLVVVGLTLWRQRSEWVPAYALSD
jgi:uncharacterized protein with PQ loop repeat